MPFDKQSENQVQVLKVKGEVWNFHPALGSGAVI